MTLQKLGFKIFPKVVSVFWSHETTKPASYDAVFTGTINGDEFFISGFMSTHKDFYPCLMEALPLILDQTKLNLFAHT